ncbi:hypothetical protein [Thiolapillus sp.]|uniref:hypothetical protein n=1 Tax=Thiolapillus sp. TaxID=2017437 RepID=UPI003AF59E5A
MERHNQRKLSVLEQTEKILSLLGKEVLPQCIAVDIASLGEEILALSTGMDRRQRKDLIKLLSSKNLEPSTAHACRLLALALTLKSRKRWASDPETKTRWRHDAEDVLQSMKDFVEELGEPFIRIHAYRKRMPSKDAPS